MIFFSIALAFQAFSLASSSFVEEEHQTWYFLTITMLLALFVLHLKRSWRHCSDVPPIFSGSSSSSSVAKENLVVRLSVWCQNGTVQWVFLLGLHLLMRRLNQTGDKWLNVPDLGDWLTMESNRIWNSFFVVICKK